MVDFEKLQRDVLGVFHVWRTNADGKRVAGPSLLELHDRFEKQDAKAEEASKNRPASFRCDHQGNPIMENGSRIIDTERTTPERAERLAKLQEHYSKGEEVSPFGEYEYTEDFFGEETEHVIAEPVVEIGDIDYTAFLEALTNGR